MRHAFCFQSLIHIAVQALLSYLAATLGFLFLAYSLMPEDPTMCCSDSAPSVGLLNYNSRWYCSLVLISYLWQREKKVHHTTSAGLQFCLKFRPSQRFHTPTTCWLREPPQTVNLLCQCFVLLNPLTHVKNPFVSGGIASRKGELVKWCGGWGNYRLQAVITRAGCMFCLPAPSSLAL